MKILIMSFPRSGTSLTNNIFNQHKDVHQMWFEQLLLWKKQEHLLEQGTNTGEKIIYEQTHFAKGKYTYLEYCDWWNEKYGDEARIFNIIRHPYDVWNSIIKNKYISRSITRKICINLKKYFECVPKYIQAIDKYPNSFTFKYEHLLQEPEYILNKLYTYAGLDPSRTNFKEKISSKKLFLYKRKGFIINDEILKHQKDEFWEIMNYNLPNLINIMNKFDGPKYEV